jgi:parallel beta-helix repeat protein
MRSMNLRAARIKKYRLTIPALFFLLPLTVVSAHGQTQITSCGTVIRDGGEYVLANDLDCAGNGITVSFNTQQVELNLSGHRITGSNSPNKAGIRVESAAPVLIQGPGVISNFTAGDGIVLVAGGVQIYAVTCTGNQVGFYLSPGIYGKETQAIVRDSVAENNVDGFYVASGGELTGNLANGNSQDGIFIATTQRARFSRNIATFNGRYGIATNQGSNNKDIRSNTALDNDGYDLFDGNSNCQNKWSDNTSGTSKGPCFQ